MNILLKKLLSFGPERHISEACYVEDGWSVNDLIDIFTTADSKAFAFAFAAEYVARSAFAKSSSRPRKNKETASIPLVSLLRNAAVSVIPPTDDDVALFSIWIQPSSVLPSKSEIADRESCCAQALLIPREEHPTEAHPASAIKPLRLS